MKCHIVTNETRRTFRRMVCKCGHVIVVSVASKEQTHEPEWRAFDDHVRYMIHSGQGESIFNRIKVVK